jgi:hypothetical protein
MSPSRDHPDVIQASHDVRECVSEYQQFGRTTVKAFTAIAEELAMSKRRPQTLFYLDEDIVVRAGERRWIAMGIVRLLERLATKHEAAAALCRAKAEHIRLREQRDALHEPCGNASGDGLGIFIS